MKWLFIPLLWALAAVLAAAVLWRLYRGKNIVLRGRWSPRVIRMVAILLVVLGVGVERRPSAAPVTPPGKAKTDAKSDELPATLTPAQVRQWLYLQTPVRNENVWWAFKQEMVRVQSAPDGDPKAALALLQNFRALPKLSETLKADLDAVAAKKAPPRLDAGKILALYDEAEENGYYDHWLNAYLWRKTADGDAAAAKQLAEVYARMYRHARVTDALIRAHGEVKPYMVPAKAWASKGGAHPAERNLEEKAMGEMLESAKKLYAAIDGGTWKRDGVAVLTVAKDSPAPVLLRAGRRQPLPSGEAVRFGRLDLIETPAGDRPVTLEHAWLGRVTLPADRTVSVWQLSGLLSDEGQKKLNKDVQAALDGDEDAADRLELVLPLAHAAMRAAVAESPKAKLAPRLRLMLALFDDTVMPVLVPPKPENPFGPGGGFGPGGPPGGGR
jgi:hypothetical protein